jgi:hypothetical protein
MPITFTCRCGNVLRTVETNAGKPGKCPACSTPFVVPFVNGSALPAPQTDISDYPLRRATRQPVREGGRFDRLTVDDVQLRPRLDVEDEEQKIERRRHRMTEDRRAEFEYEEDAATRPSLKRPITIFTIGVLLMIGGGTWFRLNLDQGVIVIQAPFVMLAGLVLTLVGALGYIRVTRGSRKR